METNGRYIKKRVIFVAAIFPILTSITSIAQQSDEEMMAEAQRKLNADVFGMNQAPVPQRSELEIYISNAQQNNIRPRENPPGYWTTGYTCAQLEQRSYIDYRDCMYYYHVYGRYWAYPVVVVRAPVVAERKTVTRSSQNFNISEEYDEDALNDYYKWLKNYAPMMNTIGMVTSEQIKQNSAKGFNYQSLFTLLSSSLESHKIELEAWPLEMRKKAWDAMGKRIESHSKLFEKYRALALENEAIDPSFKHSLKSISLIEKESFLSE
ncbi:hypothetical protein [Flavobacterium sp. W21_SRS_FM6]|uniref:hypothetical protein n=1 Tax=Flavobacterium sp. W21_SRS_FM6 TaxID=3240268 RepID=UPI003F9047CC